MVFMEASMSLSAGLFAALKTRTHRRTMFRLNYIYIFSPLWLKELYQISGRFQVLLLDVNLIGEYRDVNELQSW